VVELKRETVEGKGEKKGHDGWLATNLWPTGHAWPPLNLYIHHPLNLVPLMLTPLTKSIKSKPNSFHLFPKFFLFIFKYFIFYILYFILCNDEINMLWKRSKKSWMKRGEIKIKYANGGRRVKNEICDNYRFILPTRASHFSSVNKTISISKDLDCQCDLRICRN
jgi:hypothetical protein